MKPPEQAEVAEFVTRLFGAHDHQIRRYLQRLLGSKEAAEEVAQGTYTKLFRLCRPEEVKCPGALLFNMATKEAIDYLRAGRLGTTIVGQVAEVNRIPDAALSLDRQVAIEKAMGHLKRIIQELNPTYRSVFVLRYVRQLHHEEIARLLNISVDAAQQCAAAASAEFLSKFAALSIDPVALD